MKEINSNQGDLMHKWYPPGQPSSFRWLCNIRTVELLKYGLRNAKGKRIKSSESNSLLWHRVDSIRSKQRGKFLNLL